MNLWNEINLITIVIAGIFIIPVIAGIFNPVTSHRMRNSVLSMLNNIEIIIGIILTFYLYRVVLYEKHEEILNSLYQWIPPIKELMSKYEQNIVARVIFLFLLLSIILVVLRLLTFPIRRFVLIPLTNRISVAVNSLGGISKRVLGGLWQVPRSVWMVVVFSLLLNLYTNVGSNVSYRQYIKESTAYRMVTEKVLNALLGSDFAQKIPVLINDSFRKMNENLSDVGIDRGLHEKEGIDLNHSELPMIKYFNGVTLDEAIQSNEEIDQTAKQVASSEKEDKRKAYLLYEWICSNIRYDYDKAEKIVTDPTVVASGSEVAYAERKGVCFDYSTLYVSMCRAVGLNVRLVTGLGYSGTQWGDHAWNQVYDSQEQRWINVDTTFGSAGYDSFDNSDFLTIHKYTDVQGEW